MLSNLLSIYSLRVWSYVEKAFLNFNILNLTISSFSDSEVEMHQNNSGVFQCMRYGFQSRYSFLLYIRCGFKFAFCFVLFEGIGRSSSLDSVVKPWLKITVCKADFLFSLREWRRRCYLIRKTSVYCILEIIFLLLSQLC